MLSHHARRLARRLIILLVLAAALTATSSGPVERSALAVVPCEQCEENYNACVTSCGDPAPSACLFFCQNRYNRCLSTCE
jgi:hypothetical protein